MQIDLEQKYPMLIQLSICYLIKYLYPKIFSFSGFLVSYLTLKELDKVNGKLNLIMFYVHRYIRLTIPLAFITAFYIFALPGVAYLMQSQVYFAHSFPISISRSKDKHLTN